MTDEERMDQANKDIIKQEKIDINSFREDYGTPTSRTHTILKTVCLAHLAAAGIPAKVLRASFTRVDDPDHRGEYGPMVKIKFEGTFVRIPPVADMSP